MLKHISKLFITQCDYDQRTQKDKLAIRGREAGNQLLTPGSKSGSLYLVRETSDFGLSVKLTCSWVKILLKENWNRRRETTFNRNLRMTTLKRIRKNNHWPWEIEENVTSSSWLESALNSDCNSASNFCQRNFDQNISLNWFDVTRPFQPFWNQARTTVSCSECTI